MCRQYHKKVNLFIEGVMRKMGLRGDINKKIKKAYLQPFLFFIFLLRAFGVDLVVLYALKLELSRPRCLP
jgi:hypothetical protein